MSILEKFSLQGRHALVTGGSRGLGRAMALGLAEAGADITITGRDAESLDRTARKIEALGRNVRKLVVDMGDPEACEASCRQLAAGGPPIDILINNVGGRRSPLALEDMPMAQWRELMDLNLTITVVCTKLIGGAMAERIRAGGSTYGRVINISSMNAIVSGQNIGGRHYETAKAAVLQFTRAMAVDWAPLGITVNAILPGLFMTEPNKRWAREKPEIIDGIVARTPMGKGGEPEDLGALAVYLASDTAGFMTGAGLVIDGGYTLV